MPITPDLASLRLAASALNIFESLGIDESKLHIIVNWTMSSGGISTERIEKYLRRKTLLTIPHVDGLWQTAINYGKPVILGDDNHPLIGLLEDICWKFSTTTDRSRKDPERSDMWKRIAKRRLKRKSDNVMTKKKK
jgi:Flp pilus assembly CpaE family ATPase